MYSTLAKLADYLEKHGAEKEAREIKQSLTKISAAPLPMEKIEEGIRESRDEEFKKELKEEGWKNPKVIYPKEKRPLEFDTKLLEKSIRDSIQRSIHGRDPEKTEWDEDKDFVEKLQKLLREKGYDIVETPSSGSGEGMGMRANPPLPRKASIEEVKKLPGTEKFPYDYEDKISEEEIRKSIIGIEKILEDPAVAPDFKKNLAETLAYLRDKLKEVRNMPKEYKEFREDLREDLQAGERTNWADDKETDKEKLEEIRKRHILSPRELDVLKSKTRDPKKEIKQKQAPMSESLKQRRMQSMLPSRDPEAVKLEQEEIEEVKSRQEAEEIGRREQDAPARQEREEAEAEFNDFLTNELGMTLKEFKKKFEDVAKSNWRGPVGKLWERDPETEKMVEQKISKLLELADRLDKSGAVKEANMIDEFLKTACDYDPYDFSEETWKSERDKSRSEQLDYEERSGSQGSETAIPGHPSEKIFGAIHQVIDKYLQHWPTDVGSVIATLESLLREYKSHKNASLITIFKKLSEMSDRLDKSGAVEEANMIDEFLKTAADVKWKGESDTEQAKRYDSKHHHSLQVREPKREQEKVDREGRKDHHIHTYQETGASALSTRYCPNHIGVMLGRVGVNTYQCPLDGAVYNWETGWVDPMSGERVPGGSVAAQTPASSDVGGVPHRMFDSRENILNRIN